MKKNLFITLFLFLLIPFSNGQAKFSELSSAEKKWVLLHPISSIKVKKRMKNIYKILESVKADSTLDKYENGGKTDAFRHIFTMAFLSKHISLYRLRALGKAHEEGNFEQFQKKINEDGELPDSVSCEMDLRNNEIGFLVGKKNKNASIDSLKKIILNQIRSGDVWIIKRNNKGDYLTCNDSVINFNEVKDRWRVAKCLIKSNQ
ncbi:MAG: DUF6973 domain-containing protein [Bacteroidota bacterium]